MALARLMESQILHQLAGSVEEGFSKGTMASALLDATHLSFSLCTTGALQAAALVLELRGRETEWVRQCVVSLRGISWSSSNFFHSLKLPWF